MGNVSTRDWLTLEEAKRQTSYGRNAILSMVARGQIGILRIEGLPDKYSARDIRDLVAASTIPSRAARRELVGAN